jgi:chromosome transmission fidelity protein 18
MFYLLQSMWKFHLTVESERTGQARDPHVKRPILRPIICICNDINASSLVKLRSYALQIRFNRPADIHIVKRLKEICQIEGLKTDSRALNTLVSVAKGDLRGCLNTLQVCGMAIIFLTVILILL